ncbi:biopolymer transporter ExbB [Psychromarinibacter sp. C21-152]|uniref:Biopolymer transporter ExbB n=1 Tax=Psychromarinibacter sediminicola TaxID=3033385 RepID=A0AAE3NRM2_9RHOB|nr:biopolymer transporter ExbB [Psychromarinibacter sediminicola]MDF0603018.1 biopolymer transporter ExbB [Psychromarinibacter sediminicola]
MDQADREAEPYFSQPVRQIVLMIVVLGLVGFGAYIAYPRVAPVFLANPWLNGFILAVFVFGILACFWQAITLVRAVNWIVGFAGGDPEVRRSHAPRILAPLAALLKGRDRRMQISAASSRSILDSVATRIDELRDITRYITNLLIFLGLLGTFYGLATTVPAVVDTIRSLAPQGGESGIEVFNRLMTGLEAQLGGMGVAFASSLLGLAGSLVVGLLELFASHGQNRFYRELEEWLSTITRLGFSSGDDGATTEQDAVVAVLEHMDRQMEGMREMFVQSDVSRAMVDERLGSLSESIDRMVTRLDREDASTAVLSQIADSQQRLIEVLENQAAQGGSHVDAESRMRLRSIDVQLLRILEEMSAGRQESTVNLRQDLAVLTQAVRDLTAEAEAAEQRG